MTDKDITVQVTNFLLTTSGAYTGASGSTLNLCCKCMRTRKKLQVKPFLCIPAQRKEKDR